MVATRIPEELDRTCLEIAYREIDIAVGVEIGSRDGRNSNDAARINQVGKS